MKLGHVKYQTFVRHSNDSLLNFESFYNYILGSEIGYDVIITGKNSRGLEVKAISEEKIHSFSISSFSEEEKIILYKDCKSEIISIKEYFKRQTNFNEIKFLSVKRKYRDILKLMQEQEPFIFEDDVLKYLDLENYYQELFIQAGYKRDYYQDNKTIQNFIEQLENSEKEFKIGMNFKRLGCL